LVKYVFVPQLSVKIEIIFFFETWIKLRPLILKMCEFNHFNQILLNLFDISNVFLS